MLSYCSRSPRRSRSLLAPVVLVALVAACSSDTGPGAPLEIDGAPVAVGQGSAYTFVQTGDDGARSIGIALTPTALDGLPPTDTEWSLPMPTGADAPPFDHIALDWNPEGHPPAPYQVPHFDFHFYTIPPATQAAVVPGPDTIPVPAANVPQDYMSGVIAVPDMGVHWVDTTSTEFHGQPFERTFIYGFYHGDLFFLEPMVTRAFLQSAPDVTMPVKQPQAFARQGRYPMTYSVRTDAASNTIRVALDSLVAR